MKSITVLQKEYEVLMQEIQNIDSCYFWLPDVLQDIHVRYGVLQFDELTFRQRMRIKKKCNDCLKHLKNTCLHTFQAVHPHQKVPDWLTWERGKGYDFYTQLIWSLSKLDVKTVHVISLALPKSLSSYEEDVTMLKKLSSSGTSKADYDELRKLIAGLEGLRKLVI